MITVGSCNSEVTDVLLQTIMDRPELKLKDTYARFLSLVLGRVYVRRQEFVETVTAALEIIQGPFGSMATTMFEIGAYGQTGNVLKI